MVDLNNTNYQVYRLHFNTNFLLSTQEVSFGLFKIQNIHKVPFLQICLHNKPNSPIFNSYFDQKDHSYDHPKSSNKNHLNI